MKVKALTRTSQLNRRTIKNPPVTVENGAAGKSLKSERRFLTQALAVSAGTT